MSKQLLIRYLGLQDYNNVWEAMRHKNRSQPWTGDELWLCEHESVYTLGSQGGIEHLKAPTHIPIVPTDRGGSITYHGPGQLVIYPLLDIRAHAIGIKAIMDRLEECMRLWIQPFIPTVHCISDMRGLYINTQKLASMGLRIANGRTYHGISVNISMDQTPFDNIHPCGYADLRMTQWTDHSGFPEQWNITLEQAFCHIFNYTQSIRGFQDARVTDSKITWPRQTG